MHVLPARVTRVLLAVMRDPVAWLVETTQFFDVQMQHIAGVWVLVTHNRRGRLQRCQAVQAFAGKPAAKRAGGYATFRADLTIGATAASLLKSFLPHVVGQGVWTSSGTRGTVVEPGLPLVTKAAQPFVGGADTDATGLSGLFGAKSAIEHAIAQKSSTVGR